MPGHQNTFALVITVVLCLSPEHHRLLCVLALVSGLWLKCAEAQ